MPITEIDNHRPKVALFVTCLVDLCRPSVGFAALRLLEHAQCHVTIPTQQTCCGQPAFNNGDKHTAQALAKQHIALFESFDYVVIPSGSCAGMLRQHYPTLLADDPVWAERAAAFAARCYELTQFLHDVRPVKIDCTYPHTVTYHDACAGLRELGVQEQPRALLNQVKQLTLTELKETEACCGFGGTFCVKYPEISTKMVDDKIAHIAQTYADVVLAGDLGCLLNIAGRLHRHHLPIAVYHVAEVLAGMATEIPAVGQP
ncbi:(Fe-S)-binding protein [Thioflexithrix psekupsensis]|uniref:Fe-S oxidoreductase n=1 Tax=Thioflexithrix psekupsensis TaxID=1570016 RepID=A0A251XAC2_9GAMM|nr:(Fe-S)-binding protein [Thioflexithrix psekupsensis]OUD15284.1 Fe-S oxidoreductase [Thioflexithrix psekupsensis]